MHEDQCTQPVLSSFTYIPEVPKALHSPIDPECRVSVCVYILWRIDYGLHLKKWSVRLKGKRVRGETDDN